MICAIVVLYEPQDNELKNILSYCDFVDYLFVLDNSKKSNEENVAFILKDYNKYEYKHFPVNIGLCKALNYGMYKAKQLNFKWALVMDSDSLVLSNIIKEYKNYLVTDLKNKVAVFAPVHIFDRSNNAAYEGYRKIKWAMTSGCLFNISIFERLKGFKEELYVDGLDIDYCYKARKNNYEIYEIGKALILHHPGETRTLKIGKTKLFKYGYASPWRYYMQARALVWIILEYRSLSDIPKFFYKWIKVILFFENKLEYIKNLSKGSIEGIRLWYQNNKIT